MTIVRYWDMPPRARALMPAATVETYLDLELAEKGVLRVHPPTLLPVEPVHLPTKTFYRVKTGYIELAIFATMEQATAFIELGPVRSDYNYECGSDRRYAITSSDFAVEPIQLASQADYTNALSVIRQNAANAKENERLQHEFQADCAAVNAALQDVWEDWHEQRRKEAAAQKILSTWNDYLTLAQGNPDVARSFLLKVFTPGAIADACEWLGEDCPALMGGGNGQ